MGDIVGPPGDCDRCGGLGGHYPECPTRKTERVEPSINWQQWAYRELKSACVDAIQSGADYIRLGCPRCSRVRLEPETTGLTNCKLRCEKCGWRAKLKKL